MNQTALEGGATVFLNDRLPEESESDTDDVIDSYLGNISDHEDPTYVQTCEAIRCKGEVFAACHICLKLLCFNHFEKYIDSCTSHNKTCKKKNAAIHNIKKNKPEDFILEGERKENEMAVKDHGVNKYKLAKKLRDMGKEYVRPKTGVTVAARKLKERCNSNNCKKQNRQCSLITEEQRMEIFKMFTDIGNLTSHREFIVRHIEVVDTATKTSGKDQSRREKSRRFFLTVNSQKYRVCKTLFLHTLGITDKTMRTSLAKLSTEGVLQKEGRGGRQSAKVIERDKIIRAAVLNHIQRFPKVEAHYCRASSSKEYLHPDLTVSKMHNMFLQELGPNDEIPSIDFYRKVFRSLNLSFHRPKKDQCSLCLSYKQGDESCKEKLKDKYNKHFAEKNKVREIKQALKEKALADNSTTCASFDLQQVIYLPQCKENAIFYKRRLANYNFTFYDIASKECHCFIWSEVCSQRGASEISSCVYRALQKYDMEKRARSVALFSDGCSGQNKNSVIATMLLYAVANSSYIEEISLRFFESFHGQNEGDSAHSAVSTALSRAGDLFIPSQLYPIIHLARYKQPYQVHPLQHSDFLDFKKLSRDLRVLSIRTSETGKSVKWHDIMELKVTKKEPLTIFYKTSHLHDTYEELKLKRQKVTNLENYTIEGLNYSQKKISKEKYEDLKSLCEGDTPVIRFAEFKRFYLNIPHHE